MPIPNLNEEQIDKLYNLACDLRNALHGYESLHPDPTVRNTLDEFDTFLVDNHLVD